MDAVASFITSLSAQISEGAVGDITVSAVVILRNGNRVKITVAEAPQPDAR